jgi:hypothetical protein
MAMQQIYGEASTETRETAVYRLGAHIPLGSSGRDDGGVTRGKVARGPDLCYSMKHGSISSNTVYKVIMILNHYSYGYCSS